MQPRPKLRLWQLSLRTLLLTTTLICIGTGVYARWMRPRKLELLVEEFNTAIDECRYDDACAIGREAKWGYPEHVAASLLSEKGEYARQIATNTAPVGGSCGETQCYFGDDVPGNESEGVVYMDTKKWEEIVALRKRR
ncbi:MAG: hypothetical protein ACKVP0_12115 [Pirellulaceae bacterium]